MLNSAFWLNNFRGNGVIYNKELKIGLTNKEKLPCVLIIKISC